MSARSPRIAGTAATRSFAVPVCSVHGTKTVRNDEGEFYCPACMDDWLKELVAARTKTSIGGVDLPVGVRDTRRDPSFAQIHPNRAARRRSRRLR